MEINFLIIKLNKEEKILDYAKESLKLHYEWKGKIEVTPRASVDNKEALSGDQRRCK